MLKVGQLVKAHLGENFMAEDIQDICIGKVGVIVRVLKRREMCYHVKFESGQKIYLCSDEVSPVGAKVV
mgnify:CR=1 FL=1